MQKAKSPLMLKCIIINYIKDFTIKILLIYYNFQFLI